MPTIADVRGVVQAPQFSWSWEVEIQGRPDVLDNMTLYAKSVSIPETAVEIYQRDFKGAKTMYASRDASAHTVTITFMDDEDLTILTYFQNWMNLIQNPLTGTGVSRDIYAADMVIRLKSSDDEKTTGEIHLGHCFPTNLAEVALDYTNSEAIEVSVTLSYDEKTLVK